jgi:hypothetical protein
LESREEFAMDKKHQHVIPKSYLQAWCDPTTPAGHEPYVWVHHSDGGEGKRKAPRSKWFTEIDRYTIKSPTGDRNLDIEDTLGNLENQFVGLREKLQARKPVTAREHVIICAFVAAMCSRNKPAANNWGGFHTEIRK